MERSYRLPDFHFHERSGHPSCVGALEVPTESSMSGLLLRNRIEVAIILGLPYYTSKKNSATANPEPSQE